MSQGIEQFEIRKPYETPQLTTISLRPEEAVLGACKSPSSGNFQQGGCAIILGACNNIGS
jgi:hypothetical protein